MRVLLAFLFLLAGSPAYAWTVIANTCASVPDGGDGATPLDSTPVDTSGADLIVVGHRRQSAFDRWWSGPKGAYLMDCTDCSLLVARNAVSDEAIGSLLSQE